MAVLVADVATSVLAATASDAGVQLAVNWLNDRYKELVARARTRQLRNYSSVFVPAPITTGTVNVTQGGETAVLSTPIPNGFNVVGWTIRANIVWYVVVAIANDSVTLTIDSPYSESTNTASSYTLVNRYIPVQPNFRWISSVVHPRRRKRLRELPFEQFQSQHPARPLVAAFPWCWTEASRYISGFDISTVLGVTGQKLIEIYPPSNIDETYGYVGWPVPASFAITATLPPEIDEHILREGILVDVWRYKSEQAAAKGNVELAGYYANRESRQRTIWEGCIQQALVADALYHNNVALEIDMFSDCGEWTGAIETAHQWIVSEWTE